MRVMEINKRAFSYCLYSGTIDIADEYGNESGEKLVTYREPVFMRANVSAAKGYAQTEQFGNLDSYDKVIVTEDVDCPIDENTVLFLDKEPEFREVTIHERQEADTLFGDGEIEPLTVQVPLYDYTVRRVAKSINSVSFAVQKVSTT